MTDIDSLKLHLLELGINIQPSFEKDSLLSIKRVLLERFNVELFVRYSDNFPDGEKGWEYWVMDRNPEVDDVISQDFRVFPTEDLALQNGVIEACAYILNFNRIAKFRKDIGLPQ